MFTQIITASRPSWTSSCQSGRAAGKRSTACRCDNDINSAQLSPVNHPTWNSISRKIGIAIWCHPYHSVFPARESGCARVKPVSVISNVAFVFISVIGCFHDRRSICRSRGHCHCRHIMAVLRVVAVTRTRDISIASGLWGICAGAQE